MEKRKTRIESMEDAEQVRPLIGEQNFAGARRALADGASVWVFLSPKEVDENHDLAADEKEACKQRFAETGGKYAGWVRPPQSARQPVPGLEPVPGYDTHGNYRGGSTGGSDNWSPC